MVHFGLTLFAVTATAHHWWLDGIVALGLLWFALTIDTLGRRVVRAWRSAPAETAPDDALLTDHAR
jgi:hypothetical protein